MRGLLIRHGLAFGAAVVLAGASMAKDMVEPDIAPYLHYDRLLFQVISAQEPFSAVATISGVRSGQVVGTKIFPIIYNPGRLRVEYDKCKEEQGLNFSKEVIDYFCWKVHVDGEDFLTHIYDYQAKRAYIIYPSLKAYFTTNLTESLPMEGCHIGPGPPPGSKPEQATKDGHLCTLETTTVLFEGKDEKPARLWHAADLKWLSVEAEILWERGWKDLVRFKQIVFAAPAPDAFAPPKEFKEYRSYHELKQAEILPRRNATTSAQPSP